MKLASVSFFCLLVGSSLAIDCLNPRYTPVKNQCKEILCNADSQCKTFKGGCAGKGTTFCRPSDGICGCTKDKVAPYSNRNNCNEGYKCLTGEVCATAGNCVKNPLCHTRAEVCSATEKCCPGFFCHTRLSEPKVKKCYRAANPGEACGPGAGNGIPCINGSVCQAKTRVCSKATK